MKEVRNALKGILWFFFKHIHFDDVILKKYFGIGWRGILIFMLQDVIIKKILKMRLVTLLIN